MSDTYDWTSRVEQATGASVHEQLRTVVRDTEEMLSKFTTTAYEQGGLLLDAQREMEGAVERKIADLSAGLNASLDSMRKDIASIEPAAQQAVDLEPLRKEIFAGLAAFGEELDTETKKIREEMGARMAEIGGRISAMEKSLAGMEERAAARMVELLATAFTELSTAPATTTPTAIAS